MKFYQIILLLLIEESFQLEKDNDSSSYHIEFEDKNPNGGYGYKIQVSNKGKRQEVWRNPDEISVKNNSHYPQNRGKKIINHLDSHESQSEQPQLEAQPHQYSTIKYSQPNINQYSTLNIDTTSDSKYEPNTATQIQYYEIQSTDPQPEKFAPSKFYSNQPQNYESKNQFEPSYYYLTRPTEQINHNYYARENVQTFKQPINNYYSSEPSMQIIPSDSNKGPRVMVESTSGNIKHQIPNQFTLQSPIKNNLAEREPKFYNPSNIYAPLLTYQNIPKKELYYKEAHYQPSIAKYSYVSQSPRTPRIKNIFQPQKLKFEVKDLPTQYSESQVLEKLPLKFFDQQKGYEFPAISLEQHTGEGQHFKPSIQFDNYNKIENSQPFFFKPIETVLPNYSSGIPKVLDLTKGNENVKHFGGQIENNIPISPYIIHGDLGKSQQNNYILSVYSQHSNSANNEGQGKTQFVAK